MHYCSRASVGTLLTLLCLAPIARAEVTTNLFQDLKGFGAGTTGGQAGEIYTVDLTTDTYEQGTLRHAIESATGPRWIKFDDTVFLPDVKKAIYLTSPIYLKSNITIDGRGSYVSIRKRYSYDDATWTQTDTDAAECLARVPTPENPLNYDMGPMFLMRSVENVVITHIDFVKIYEGTPPSYSIRDKQCFGDVVGIYNASTEQVSKYFDKIWINRSTFADCGDECVAITRSSSVTGKVANITLSGNFFRDTYKAIVLGSGYEGDNLAHLSLYNNRFYNVRQRSPRVQDAVAHVFNNAFESWGSHGVAMVNDHETAIHQNVFYAGSRTIQPWVSAGTPLTLPASWANKYYGVDNPTSYENSAPSSGSSFDNRIGDAYDLTGYSFSGAINWIRDRAGWKNVINDAQ